MKTFPNDKVEYEDVFNCVYLNAVMDEVQRMRFTVVRQFRTAAQDYDLHAPGMNCQNRISLKAGQVISVSTYSVHHDPSLFPEPFQFRPERFLNGEVAEGTYMPFSAGPRLCIAYRFAKIIIRVVMIGILKKFQVSTTSSTHIPLRYKLMNFSMDFEELRLKFETREQKVSKL